ncbi:hypothetical protein [Spirosoma radiotolerans]|uniref:Uncharacterized protein n=1 Tax=Spirosoma radiotolerans TaxID=1379870 RepID=A0A0E3ZYF2_9BACT|nr:hypothetical protein [Spirosoma radiotolerans]AKD56774.1 hypothetical protein SD10_19590 [Spirosoma radiotolerans]
MKTLLHLTVVFLSLSIGHAQTRDTTKANSSTPLNQRNGYETYQSTNQIVGAGPNSMVNTIDTRYEGLKGTPYFLPDWIKGQVEMTTGKNYTNVPLKFNAHKQQLILLRTGAGNDSIIVDANQVKRFTLNSNDGQAYVFERLPMAKTSDQALKDGYFLVLYAGKNALLKRVAKTFKSADYKNPYASDVRYDAYQNAFSYYLLKPDQTLTKVKLSDKSIIDALGDRKDDLKAFVKQENLTFKTDNDAILLIKKYDSL